MSINKIAPEFESKISKGEFIEFFEYNGNLYGTSIENGIVNGDWIISPKEPSCYSKFVKRNIELPGLFGK